MKDNFLTICFLILVGASCQKKSSALDETILSCFDTRYQEEGYDIKTIIDDYEKLMIREGVLMDGSGKSYLDVMKKAYSDRDFRIDVAPFQDHDPWYKVNKEIVMAVFRCQSEKIEALKKKNAKWEKVFGNTESPDNIENPEQIHQAMKETMSEEDFRSYFFRLKMFSVFDGVNINLREQASNPPVLSN